MSYYCQECGYKTLKWLGRCPECGSWNTIVEEKELPKKEQSQKKAKVFKLSDIKFEKKQRILTGIEELDIVLGGGIVPSSLILIGGDPGIGKSTLLLQVADALFKKGLKIVYVSAEESVEQISIRAERLGISKDFFFISETDLSAIITALEEISPDLVIVDSIQTVYLPELSSSPGGVSQIRECSNLLMRFAKSKNCIVFLVGHITKGGIIAGPKVLEHLVDVVLYLEGEKETGVRILRAVKNRFGALNEIGVFLMTEKGLVSYSKYEDFFLSEENGAVFCIIEGTRPLLVEVQALVSKSFLHIPRRTAVGIDPFRVSLIVAILEKRLGYKFFDQDIYLKVSGGLKITEPSADLAVAVALVSSLTEKEIPKATLFLGELGLTGEIRPIRDINLRLKEAEKKGFKQAFIPLSYKTQKINTSLKVIPVKNLSDVLNMCF